MDQFVPSPVVSELVCTCKDQPMWSAGQDKFKFPPDTLRVIFVGLVLTEFVTTRRTSWLLIIANEAVNPLTIPFPATVIDVGAAPATVPPSAFVEIKR